MKSTYSYIHKFDNDLKDKLKPYIGMRLILLVSYANKVHCSFTLDNIASFSAFGGITVAFLNHMDTGIVNFVSKPLGDTYIDDRFSNLQVTINQIGESFHKWHKENISLCERVSTFSVNEEVVEIQIYSYVCDNKQLVDEHINVTINADIDALIVVKTVNDRLVVIRGNEIREGVLVNVYPPSTHQIFREHFLDRTDQWGENLYTLRQTIS